MGTLRRSVMTRIRRGIAITGIATANWVPKVLI
jgi:hypothetical protein